MVFKGFAIPCGVGGDLVPVSYLAASWTGPPSNYASRFLPIARPSANGRGEGRYLDNGGERTPAGDSCSGMADPGSCIWLVDPVAHRLAAAGTARRSLALPASSFCIETGGWRRLIGYLARGRH